MFGRWVPPVGAAPGASVEVFFLCPSPPSHAFVAGVISRGVFAHSGLCLLGGSGFHAAPTGDGVPIPALGRGRLCGNKAVDAHGYALA